MSIYTIGTGRKSQPAANRRTGQLSGGGTGNSRSLQIQQPAAGPSGSTAGPQGYAAGPQAGPQIAGPQPSGGANQMLSPGGLRIPTGSAFQKFLGGSQVQTTPIQTPQIPQVGQINVSAQRNPQLDQLLGEQKQNIADIKGNTSFASDVLGLQMADSQEGAKNAAKYLGGDASRAGARQAMQNRITDVGRRANANAQANLMLGRENMVTNAIQNQLPTIATQQSGMLDQQGIGLKAEGLRQNLQNNLFNQGLQGSRLQADVAGINAGIQQNANAQQMALLNSYMNMLRA